MIRTISFEDACKELKPKVLAAAEKKAKKMITEMNLQELRKARQVSQEDLAHALNISQASVSKLERRRDMCISTLRDFIHALGGELEIKAIFRGREVKVS